MMLEYEESENEESENGLQSELMILASSLGDWLL